jgi:threonyl-tRNA synthetase
MKVVYICHPISGDVKGNIDKILKIVRDINLNLIDVVPFVPYLADLLAMDDSIVEQRERGIKNDMALLNRGMVDELWIYVPKITRGMKSEIDRAWHMGIKILIMDPHTQVPVEYRIIMNKGF